MSGHPGQANPANLIHLGRAKGSTNKIPTDLAHAFKDVFDKAGGVEGLLAWVKKNNTNRSAFYSLVSKLLPRKITADLEAGSIIIQILKAGDVPDGKPGTDNPDTPNASAD